jgi:hypothetical protein
MGFGFTQSREVAKPQKKDFAYRFIGTASLREKNKKKDKKLDCFIYWKTNSCIRGKFFKAKNKKTSHFLNINRNKLSTFVTHFIPMIC